MEPQVAVAVLVQLVLTVHHLLLVTVETVFHHQ
jgi:hypothetical protein